MVLFTFKKDVDAIAKQSISAEIRLLEGVVKVSPIKPDSTHKLISRQYFVQTDAKARDAKLLEALRAIPQIEHASVPASGVRALVAAGVQS